MRSFGKTYKRQGDLLIVILHNAGVMIERGDDWKNRNDMK